MPPDAAYCFYGYLLPLYFWLPNAVKCLDMLEIASFFFCSVGCYRFFLVHYGFFVCRFVAHATCHRSFEWRGRGRPLAYSNSFILSGLCERFVYIIRNCLFQTKTEFRTCTPPWLRIWIMKHQALDFVCDSFRRRHRVCECVKLEWTRTRDSRFKGNPSKPIEGYAEMIMQATKRPCCECKREEGIDLLNIVAAAYGSMALTSLHTSNGEPFSVSPHTFTAFC